MATDDDDVHIGRVAFVIALLAFALVSGIYDSVSWTNTHGGITFIVPLTVGVNGSSPFPYNAKIINASLFSKNNTVGSVSVEISKSTYELFGTKTLISSGFSISDSTKYTTNTLTGWTTQINENDIIYYNVTSYNNISTVIINLQVVRT